MLDHDMTVGQAGAGKVLMEYLRATQKIMIVN